MKKVNVVLLIIVIILILLIAGWGIWKLTSDSNSKFSAVYLTTGDLYFGKMVRFPSFGIKQVYTLQVNAQDQENPLSVQKFENVFWGPGDFLKINREQVVWTTPLNDLGQMSQLLTNNPDLLPTQSQVPSQGTQIPGGEMMEVEQ